jgi:hypothetical protein
MTSSRNSAGRIDNALAARAGSICDSVKAVVCGCSFERYSMKAASGAEPTRPQTALFELPSTSDMISAI